MRKTHERLHNAPVCCVISNFAALAEETLESSSHYYNPLMISAKAYIKDTGYFFNKPKSLGKVPDNALLVTTGVAGLCLWVPHEVIWMYYTQIGRMTR